MSAARVSAGSVWMIAQKQLANRLRSGWLLACMLLWLGAVALTSFFGLLQVGQLGMQSYDRTVASLLSLVQYLAPLLGLLMGHDLVVSEREERILTLVMASGVSRWRLVLGKFLGGALTLSIPVVLGFTIAGLAIGITTDVKGLAPFLILASSGLVLALVFLGVGLLISIFSRTRVQALVMALLTWCVVVFVFDLAALGLLISTKASAAAQEIDIVCDATHVNAAADLHTAYDSPAGQAPSNAGQPSSVSVRWLMLNPVDAFRAVNLAKQIAAMPSWSVSAGSCGLWLAVSLILSTWKLRRLDL